MLDQSVRPNQILAVSLPYPVLEEQHQPQVVECVRNKLLTPFGLRTLSPDDPGYRGRYEGGPASRDAAYHQGTVWPWLLGHYTDALLRVAWDVDGAVQALLDRVTPLFCDHLTDAGLASISEIFDASPPYRPNGCIAPGLERGGVPAHADPAQAGRPRRIQGLGKTGGLPSGKSHFRGYGPGVCRVSMTLADDGEPINKTESRRG